MQLGKQKGAVRKLISVSLLLQGFRARKHAERLKPTFMVEEAKQAALIFSLPVWQNLGESGCWGTGLLVLLLQVLDKKLQLDVDGTHQTQSTHLDASL